MAGRSFADAARSATGADTAADKADSPKPIYRRVEVRDSPQQHKDAEPAVQRRAPSPSQQPRTGQEDEEKYILTLLTSHDLHKRMVGRLPWILPYNVCVLRREVYVLITCGCLRLRYAINTSPRS